MKFQIGADGTEYTGEKWSWVKLDNGMEVEMYRPTNTEHLKLLTQFGLIRGTPDWKGISRFVAKNWWRDFKGAMQDDGVTPIPNTEQARILMLDDPSVNLLDAMLPRYKQSAGDDEEGKGGSASA